MNIQNIYDLLERFEQSSVTELELEMEGTNLRLSKAFGRDQISVIPTAQVSSVENISREIPERTDEITGGTVLKAPLAGTFYRAASPEAEPFVAVGQKIKKGDVIGIIEAMKLMNEVVAEEDGTVEEILVEDGTLVAYDEGLIRYV